LISGVMGRAAEGYGKAADMEMKKQSELDLRKQLMEAETEKQLRIDEIKRGRDIAEEDRKMSDPYLTKAAAADLKKGTLAAGNRKTMAPLTAEAADVEFEAGKGLEGKKATAATTAKITEAGSLAGDAGYLTNVAKLATAAKDPEIKMNKDRADAVAGRSSGGGAGGVKVRSTYTNDQGEKVAVLSDGSTKVLGKAADYDKTLSNLVTKMAKDDYKFAKLPENEKRKKAEERLRGQIVVPSSGRDLSGLSAYERDRALN
jgi:hypothetical protein